MNAKLFVALTLLVGVCVFFVGCFGEADDPLREEVDEPDVVEVPEEIPDSSLQDLVSQGPVVWLVSHGVEEKDGRWATLRCHAEIDAPLNHHLLVYIRWEDWGHDDFFGNPGQITHGTSLIILEKGSTKTGKVRKSTLIDDAGRHGSKKLVFRLLPGEERFDALPRQFIYGERDGVPGDNTFGDVVPKGHQFNPYQVGEPSEVSHEFD